MNASPSGRQPSTAEAAGRGALEAADVAVVAVDASGRITRWNPGAERLFGFTAREALGGHLTMLMPPDRRTQWRELLDRIRRGHGVAQTERRHLTRDGGIVHATTRVTLLRDEAGEPAGAVLVAWDMGPQVELQRQHTALMSAAHATRRSGSADDRARGTARALHGALNARATMVHLLDEDGGSLRLAAHLGLSRPGTARWRSVSVDSEAGHVVLQAYRAGTIRTSFDAERRPVDLSRLRAPTSTARVAIPLRSGADRVGVLTVVVDSDRVADAGLKATLGVVGDFLAQAIHEQQLVAQLERTVEELRTANRDLDTFARAAAHDLGEPVRSLRLMTRLVVDRYASKVPEEARVHLQRVARAADRLKEMLDGLRSHAQIRRADEPTGDVDLADVVAEVEETLAHKIQESNARVETLSRLPAVRAPRLHVFEVLLNLVGNGIKFTKRRRPVVRIGARREEDMVCVWVEDNGIGIPDSSRERVFELFGRAHGREEYPGTGTGLALVSKYVDTWGGRVWNEPGREGGTRFWFTVPAATESLAGHPETAAQGA